MTQPTTKALQQAARSLLERDGISSESDIVIAPLAKRLASETGCAERTAYRHLRAAIDELRGISPKHSGRRGGQRPGAGRTPKSGERRERVSVRLTPSVYRYLTADGRTISDAIEELVRAQEEFAKFLQNSP